MKYLTGLCVMVLFCATASAEEQMLEWTLKYMVRESPAGSKESQETDFIKYRKHKKDFREKLSVTIYTRSSTAAAAKASSGTNSLRLVLVPRVDGKVRVLADDRPSGTQGVMIHIIDAKQAIKDGEEINLGTFGDERLDKTGKVIGVQAHAFILVIKRMDGDFSGLIRSSLDKKQEEGRRDELKPSPKPRG